MSNLKIQGNASGAGTTTVQSANTASSTTFTLPAVDGTNGQFLQTNGSGALTFASGATGTVTSVGLTFTGGVVSVGGSPVTSSGTLALTVAGTSGGIPYFSSASTWATSAALAANALVIGGGAGAAPSTTTTGTGILTFLGTPSSSNLASAVTDETGSGSLVFATSPTLVTPILGTPTSGTLSNCTVDGTNAVGFRSVPPVGTKTGSYTLATGDVGKYVQVGSGGSITIPDATFSEGNAISIFNNTSGAITITCTITTAYIAGTFTDKATMSLAAAGVATILFISGTTCVVSGNVS
jgi:hypothetical protein